MIGNGIISRDLEILDDLMLVSSTRGTDGTGLAAGHGRKGVTHKIVGDPFYWRYMLEGKAKAFENLANNFYIGHTRWRSVGKVEQAGVQPFIYDNIIGTHNGTIQSMNWEGYSSDSMKLIWDINSAKGDTDKVFSNLYEDDAFALVWYDFEKKVVHFANNGWRSLFFAVNKKRNVLYWASEQRFLNYALGKKPGRAVEEYEVYYFDCGYHYTVPIHKVRASEWETLDYLERTDLPKAKEWPKKEPTIIEGETAEELLQIPWMRDTRTGEVTPIKTIDQQPKLKVVH